MTVVCTMLSLSRRSLHGKKLQLVDQLLWNNCFDCLCYLWLECLYCKTLSCVRIIITLTVILFFTRWSNLIINGVFSVIVSRLKYLKLGLYYKSTTKPEKTSDNLIRTMDSLISHSVRFFFNLTPYIYVLSWAMQRVPNV